MPTRMQDTKAMLPRKYPQSTPKSRLRSKGRSHLRDIYNSDEASRYRPMILTDPYDNSIFSRGCPANPTQCHGSYCDDTYTTGTATYPSPYDRPYSGSGHAHTLWGFISPVFHFITVKLYPFFLAFLTWLFHGVYQLFIRPMIGSNDDTACYLSHEVQATFDRFAKLAYVPDAVISGAYDVFFQAMESDTQFTGRDNLEIMIASCLWVACRRNDMDHGLEEVFDTGVRIENVVRTSREIESFLKGSGAGAPAHKPTTTLWSDGLVKDIFARFGKILELHDSVIDTAFNIYSQMMESESPSLSRNDPDVLITSCIFAACRHHDISHSFAELYIKAGVSRVEADRTFKDLESFLRSKKTDKHADDDEATTTVHAYPDTIFARFAKDLDLPDTVLDVAYDIYSQAMESKTFKRKNMKALIASAVFLACRDNNISRSFRGVFNAFGISKVEMGSTFSALQLFLHGLVELPKDGSRGFVQYEKKRRAMRKTDPEEGAETLERFSDRLGLPNAGAVTQDAWNIYMQAMDSDTFRRMDEEVIVASCLFIACRRNDVGRNSRHIYEATGVGRKELGRTFKLLEWYLRDKGTGKWVEISGYERMGQAMMEDAKREGEDAGDYDDYVEEDGELCFLSQVCSWFESGGMTALDGKIFLMLLSFGALFILVRFMLGAVAAEFTFLLNVRRIMLMAAGEGGLAGNVGK